MWDNLGTMDFLSRELKQFRNGGEHSYNPTHVLGRRLQDGTS